MAQSMEERRKELLERLGKKLKGKPVYATLQKMQRGEITDSGEQAKGLFSLGTHLCIEIEHGNLEYRDLLFEVYERAGQVMMKIPRSRT